MIENDYIFDLISKQKYKKIYKLLKNGEIINLDIKDNFNNYLISYIINNNQYNILKLIIKLTIKKILNVRIDILDNDGRTLLYNCIKFNYINIINELLSYNKLCIGISIIDIKDKIGYTSLHYSIIFNNINIFKTLLDNNADPYIVYNNGNNAFILATINKRNDMLNILLKKNNNIKIVNSNNDTLLQLAILHQNFDIIKTLINLEFINLNNINLDFGQTALHQIIFVDNYEIFKLLLNTKNININISDFHGNTNLHYILIYNKFNYFLYFISKNIKLNYNLSNIEGNIPLHIILENFENYKNIDIEILNNFILESDLNIQNNLGVTCLSLLINLNLLKFFKNILIKKPLNISLISNKLSDELLNILIEAYYNQIILNKNDLILDWEKKCLIKNCDNKIKDNIINNKISLPKILVTVTLDNGIVMNNCFYTGYPIDILFGLILLNNTFKNNNIALILDYPLTKNSEFENKYSNYKLDFNNIEILWCFQKIYYPSYFDFEIKKKIKKSKYIVIPIGIITSIGQHANILFWNLEDNIIERFEPNGSNYPIGFNYNPSLLDSLLESKFKSIDNNIKYYTPYNFLPTIGFQFLENIEYDKCKNIGDPNGFCGVWCIWWVYQRMLNINNKKLNINNIANELIKQIKYDNLNFKLIIRNFSNKIVELRDKYLEKYKLTINDWISENYDLSLINKIDKDIYNNFLKNS